MSEGSSSSPAVSATRGLGSVSEHSTPAPEADVAPQPPVQNFSDADFRHHFRFDAFLSKIKQDAHLGGSKAMLRSGDDFGSALQHDDSDEREQHWGFDPAPLLGLFQGSIEQLETFNTELSQRVQRTAEEGLAAEKDHGGKLGELEERLEQDLIKRIAKLEEKASSFTETAVQIGDRLEKIHDTKQRATECGELMQHLDELQQHKGSNFETRRRGCRESFGKSRRCVCEDYHTGWSSFFRGPPFNNDVHAVAIFVKQLRERALDLSSVLGSEAAGMRQNTDSFCDELDTHLQADFFAATEHANTTIMKKCAETLEELSGVHSENALVSSYVKQRYTGWVKREDLLKSSQEEQGLGDAPPASGPAGDDNEQQLKQLRENYHRALRFAAQESKVVKKVFPQPDKVMARFVESIIEDRVANVYLAQLFSSEPVQADPLLYCKALANAVTETRDLANQLHALGTGDLNVQKLATNAVSQFAESYWEREVSALGGIVAKNLVPMADESAVALKEARRKGSGATMEEVVKQVQQHNDKRMASVLAEVNDAVSGVEAAVVRSGQLCMEGDEGVDDRCQNIDEHDRLLDRTLHTYLESVVHVAKIRAGKQSGGSAGQHGQWHPLSVIRLVTTVASRLQQHYDQAVVANTAGDGDAGRNVQATCLQRHQALRRQTQDGVRDVLELVLQAIVKEAKAVLQQGQRREDFQVPPDDVARTVHATSACKDFVNVVNAQHYFLGEHLEADNLHSFLGSLGAELHKVILGHFYTFSGGVSIAGGSQLESDLTHYCGCVRSFNHPRVNQQFAVLRQVFRLFTARPDMLPALISGKSDAERVRHLDIHEVERLRASSTHERREMVDR